MTRLRVLQRRHVKVVKGAIERLQGANRQAGRLHRVFSEGELVQLPHALPVIDAQRVEVLKDLSQMHRADDEIVIPRT